MINEDLAQWFEYSESLINELLEDGSNDEVDHVIEHHFSCHDFAILEQAAITAFKRGYDVEEPEEAILENGAKVFAFDIITEQPLDLEVITSEIELMFELAKSCNIDYDGWGTYFEE